MANIQALPTELILLIYQHLHSIDEVENLSQSCRHFRNTLSAGGNRSRVFGQIILTSPFHKHDARLQSFLEAFQHLRRGRNSNDVTLVRKCFYAKGVDLSTAQIHAIVCRWQSMRAVDVERAESMAQLCLRFLHNCSGLVIDEGRELEVLNASSQDSDHRKEVRGLGNIGYGEMYERLSEQCLVLVMEAVMSSCRLGE